jgi:hypothetical protein
MRIDDNNYLLGNRALASVLLLYYHLLREGGFTNDQTVYLDPDIFNGFDFLSVQVTQEYQGDIDETLLQEGAVIYLLCELNDQIAEYENDYSEQPIVQKILGVYAAGHMSAVPESGKVMDMLLLRSEKLIYKDYQMVLRMIFEKYVVDKFAALLPKTMLSK